MSRVPHSAVLPQQKQPNQSPPANHICDWLLRTLRLAAQAWLVQDRVQQRPSKRGSLPRLQTHGLIQLASAGLQGR